MLRVVFLLDVFFLLVIFHCLLLVNDHQSAIWDDIFVTFCKHVRSKIQVLLRWNITQKFQAATKMGSVFWLLLIPHGSQAAPKKTRRNGGGICNEAFPFWAHITFQGLFAVKFHGCKYFGGLLEIYIGNLPSNLGKMIQPGKQRKVQFFKASGNFWF